MAIATIPPIAVIAIVTPLGPFDPEPLAEEEDEADVEEFVVEAGEGGFVVETGELLFRQLVSSEAPETLISDEPPKGREFRKRNSSIDCYTNLSCLVNRSLTILLMFRLLNLQSSHTIRRCLVALK